MAISRFPSTPNQSKTVGIVIGILLIPAGLLMTYFIFLKPVLSVYAARQWIATQCTVTDSWVGHSHSRHGGMTYRVDLEFTYHYRGGTYSSDNYQFDKGYSSGYALKKAIVDQYPPGKTITCYVNPSKAAEAVVMRDFNAGLLVGLCPLAFTLAGAAMLRGSFRKDSPPPTTPRQNAIGLGVFGLITGVVAGCVLCYQLIPEARLGVYEWNLYVLVGAFSIVALALVGISISNILKGSDSD